MTTALTALTFSTRHPMRFSLRIFLNLAFIATLVLFFTIPSNSYAKQTKTHAKKVYRLKLELVRNSKPQIIPKPSPTQKIRFW